MTIIRQHHDAIAAIPLHPRDVARAFKAKQAGSMIPVRDTLTAIGMARKLEDGPV